MLTGLQKKAVKMLYYGERVQDTASALGVHRCTIWRWECTKDFQKEWRRLDRNERRKARRHEEKWRKEQDEYWAKKMAECEEKMLKEAEKITGKTSSKFYKAWNEYEKALCRGYSLDQLFSFISNDRPLKRKGRM